MATHRPPAGLAGSMGAGQVAEVARLDPFGPDVQRLLADLVAAARELLRTPASMITLVDREAPICVSYAGEAGLPGAPSHLDVPLRTSNDEVIGSLSVLGGRAQAFADADVRLLQVLADQAVNRLEARARARDSSGA